MSKFMLPYRSVKKGLSELDIRISYLSETQEYRVAPYKEYGVACSPKKQEELSYYTDDLEDAYLTGIRLSKTVSRTTRV